MNSDGCKIDNMDEIEKIYFQDIEKYVNEINYFLRKNGYELESSIEDGKIDVKVRVLDQSKVLEFQDKMKNLDDKMKELMSFL